jgi:hypothetical protein
MTRLPVTGLRQIAEINELVDQYRDRGFDSAEPSWWQAEPAGRSSALPPKDYLTVDHLEPVDADLPS